SPAHPPEAGPGAFPPPDGLGEGEQAQAFLAELYRQVRSGEEDLALKTIYHHLYRLRQAGQVSLCERILGDVDVGLLPPVLLIAFLTITAPLKGRLPNRSEFYMRARERVRVLRGVETADRLLVGLE